MKKLPEFENFNSGVSIPSVELIDGAWPDEASHIAIRIPFEWLTEDAFANDDSEEGLNIIYIPFADLLNTRLQYEPTTYEQPSRQEAMRTIAACRRYADELEEFWVNGKDAYDQDEAVRISNQTVRCLSLKKTTLKILLNLKIETIEKLRSFTVTELTNLPNIGRRRSTEICAALAFWDSLAI